MVLIAFSRHLNMNTHTLPAFAALLLFAGCANVVHVTPGTSLEVALAKKPELLRMPLPPPSQLVANNPAPRTRHIYIPAVEPALPTNDRIEAVAELFTEGGDLMENGKNDQAISALEKAVQSDPGYSEAWERLGRAYEKVGNQKKAREAFRHSQGGEPKVSVR
jgi:tetratricopeptide (TPR) repeat protein